MHQLLFQALFYIDQHVGCGFRLNKLFIGIHFLGIEIYGLMKPTKIEVEGLVFKYLLDHFIVESVPLVGYFNVVKVMA